MRRTNVNVFGKFGRVLVTLAWVPLEAAVADSDSSEARRAEIDAGRGVSLAT